MPEKKIVLLGGGSAFFRTVLGELSITEELSGSDIVLYDTQTPHMEIMAEYGRRIASQTGAKEADADGSARPRVV